MTFWESLLLTVFPQTCVSCKAGLNTRPSCGLCSACFEVLTDNDGPRCPRCDEPGTASLCSACHDEPPPFAATRAPLVYGGPLADVVASAKFQGREDLASALGDLVARDETARALAHDASALVAVPLGRRRRRQRGYNQSVLIARRLARAWRLPLLHALTRTRDTPPQSALPLRERLANLQDAFRARRPLSGRVVLVDDVITTTATVRQAAAALRTAGATEVHVVAVGRSLAG